MFFLEDRKKDEKDDHLSLKAQLDERSIEINVIKSRYEKKVDQLKVELDISMEKKSILQQKERLYEMRLRN